MSIVLALALVAEPCYAYVQAPVSAVPVTQSKVRRKTLIAKPTASAPAKAKPKGKPRLMRIVVPCPNLPEPIEPTTFELLPILPPPETFAAPEPAVPVTAAVPEPSECECFMPVGSYVWGWGGGPGGGGGGGGFSPPRTVTVTPIPDVPVWALLLAGLGVAVRRGWKLPGMREAA